MVGLGNEIGDMDGARPINLPTGKRVGLLRQRLVSFEVTIHLDAFAELFHLFDHGYESLHVFHKVGLAFSLVEDGKKGVFLFEGKSYVVGNIVEVEVVAVEGYAFVYFQEVEKFGKSFENPVVQFYVFHPGHAVDASDVGTAVQLVGGQPVKLGDLENAYSLGFNVEFSIVVPFGYFQQFNFGAVGHDLIVDVGRYSEGDPVLFYFPDQLFVSGFEDVQV